MSGQQKCKNCNSVEIEVDSARGDAVCTQCGSVLEEQIIVSEVQFEETAHGTSHAIGQFVGADAKGGATKFGAAFHRHNHTHSVNSVESREITLRRARQGIQNLCNQLNLTQHYIDTSLNFFKMALSRNLTKGRKNTHVHAACVYLTCRTEGAALLLIDISDILQICCFELGRTYLKLSQELCINIPSIDPCLYILRFASKLEFGSSTQLVTNTALRLVQRMKRDSLHSGRKPAGLCGAALLIAARLHEFGRTSADIVKIVKVHESTLRKRLIEFGDTPTSALTLDEFMSVDLEEDQDPPSFKVARKKDKERLQKLMEEEAPIFDELQRDIEKQLENDRKKKYKRTLPSEECEEETFINQATLGTIQSLIKVESESLKIQKNEDEEIRELGPNIDSMGLAQSLYDTPKQTEKDNTNETLANDIDFTDIDDAEIDMYIMSESEYRHKYGLWHKRNADYLEQQKCREERLKKEREEGKPERKKKRVKKKSTNPNAASAQSAGEAIEKIIAEKKISSKLNYDVLKCLNEISTTTKTECSTSVSTLSKNYKHEIHPALSPSIALSPSTSFGGVKRRRLSSESSDCSSERKWKPCLTNIRRRSSSIDVKKEENANSNNVTSEEELDDEFDEHQGISNSENIEMGVAEMLRKHRVDNIKEEAETNYFDFEEYD